MSTELARRDLGTLNEDQVALIKRTIAKDATNDELALFINQCNRTGLDPFARQIYSIKRGSERVTQVSIDGARLIAERTGRYRPGSTIFYDESGEEKMVWLKGEPPAACRVTVFKDGFEVPGIPVKWSERVQNTSTWKTMPATMLAKCAEMATLRQAFPQELSGLYSTDEMGPPPPVPRAVLEQKQLVEPDPANGESGGFQQPKLPKATVTKLEAAIEKRTEGDPEKFRAYQARLREKYGTDDLARLSKDDAEELLAAL